MISNFIEGEYVGVYPVETVTTTMERRYLAIKTALGDMLVLQLVKTKENNNLELASVLTPGDIVTAHYDITQHSYQKGDVKNWQTSLTCYKIYKALE